MDRNELQTALLDTLIISATAYFAQYYHANVISVFPTEYRDLVDALLPFGFLLLATIFILFAHAQLYGFVSARRWFHPIGAFEGAWVEKISLESRPYSLAFIEFNREQNAYQLYGFGFGAKELRECIAGPGREAASWRSERLLLDTNRKALFFYSQDAKVDDVGGRKRLRNVGEIYYRQRTDSELNGQVYDLVDDVPTEPFVIERMLRIRPSHMHKALKGQDPKNQRDYALLTLYMFRKEPELVSMALENGFK